VGERENHYFTGDWGASIAWKKKKAVCGPGPIPPLETKCVFRLATALTLLFGATTATGAGAKVDTAIELEPIHVKINLDGLCAFEKLFVDDVLMTLDFKLFISVIRLIQSHCQAGAASAAFV
jgi:hypothetical protein